MIAWPSRRVWHLLDPLRICSARATDPRGGPARTGSTPRGRISQHRVSPTGSHQAEPAQPPRDRVNQNPLNPPLDRINQNPHTSLKWTALSDKPCPSFGRGRVEKQRPTVPTHSCPQSSCGLPVTGHHGNQTRIRAIPATATALTHVADRDHGSASHSTDPTPDTAPALPALTTAGCHGLAHSHPGTTAAATHVSRSERQGAGYATLVRPPGTTDVPSRPAPSSTEAVAGSHNTGPSHPRCRGRSRDEHRTCRSPAQRQPTARIAKTQHGSQAQPAHGRTDRYNGSWQDRCAQPR